MARIVHFGKFSFPHNGGIETVTEQSATGALGAGHAVTIVAFARDGAFGKLMRSGIVDIRCRSMIILASQPLGLGYLVEAIRHGRGADIVHLHLPNMLAALAAMLLPARVRVVVHWHSDVVGKGWMERVMRPLESAVLRRAACVICTSQPYADASRAVSRFREKVVVIPIGVKDRAVDDVGPDTSAAAEVENLAGCARIVLAVGRMVPYKGLDVLIAAVCRLPPDALTVIVGDGPLRESLRARSRELGLTDRIVFLGRASSAILDALFRRADLFCLSSVEKSEAFGVVLVEAMSYGVPVVATEIPGSGVPWVNQHGISGINVAPGDPDALAEACLTLLDSEETRAKLAGGARLRYEREFTEDRYVKRLLDVYDAVQTGA